MTASVASVMEIPFLSHQLISSPGNEREREDREHGDRDAAGHAGISHPVSRQASRYAARCESRTAATTPGNIAGGHRARSAARRSRPAQVACPGTGRSRPGRPAEKAGNPAPARYRPGPGSIPALQPHHHSTQTAQAIAIQDQASARTSRFRAERIGRLRCHQARHPIGQLHLQMRHPVHVPHRIGPQPAPMQRMRHRRDHHLARQQGTETS